MKQDERTPGLDDDETLVRRWSEWAKTARRGGPIVVDRSILLRGIGILENAYGSTDALRSALAPFANYFHALYLGANEHDSTLVCEATFDEAPSATITVGDFRKAFEARAALTGSPAPSTEGLECSKR